MEPYTPEFYEDVHHYPMYKQDGKTPNTDHSFRTNVARRQFAKPETAEWVGREFKAERVFARPYLGMGEAFDVNEEPVQQYAVTIQGVDMTAGEIAWYFTVRPADADPMDQDAGMWPESLPPEEVMSRGKTQADAWVNSTLQYREPAT